MAKLRIRNATGLARRQGQTLRYANTGRNGGYAPGDQPTKPTTGNRVVYGAQGNKLGVPKALQRRNQVGGPGGVYHPGAPLPPGQTPPIIPGQTVPTPQGGAGGPGNAGLPNQLSDAVRAALQEYGTNTIYGVNAIPGANRQQALASMRRFLKQAQASGVGNKGLMNFLNPTFYRGLSDPNGGVRLMNFAGKNLSDEQWKQLAQFANTNTISNATPGPSGGPSVQSALFDASPALGDQYMSLANSYKVAPNTTDPMSTTPPGALLGSDGKWHDPEVPLPAGVTLDPASNPSALPPERWWGGGNNRFEGTGQFATDPNYMQNAVNRGNAPATGTPAPAGQGGVGTFANSATAASQAGANNPGGQPQPYGPNPNYTGGLPLDPTYQAQTRLAEDQLAAQLQGLGSQGGLLQSQQDLFNARQGTNAKYATQGLRENLAARGVYNSSLYGQGLTDIGTDFLRQGQDAAMQFAQQYADIDSAISGAYGDYAQALAEALLSLQQRAEVDQYAPTPHVGRP